MAYAFPFLECVNRHQWGTVAMVVEKFNRDIYLFSTILR